MKMGKVVCRLLALHFGPSKLAAPYQVFIQSLPSYMKLCMKLCTNETRSCSKDQELRVEGYYK